MTFLFATLVSLLLVALLRRVKFADLGPKQIGWADLVSAIGMGAILAVASEQPAWLRAAVGLGWAALFVALWIDSVLFRIFTIELGPDGVGSMILSVLYEELSEMTLARRFFRDHIAFSLLPAAIITSAVLLLSFPFPFFPPSPSPSPSASSFNALLLGVAATSTLGLVLGRKSLLGAFLLPRPRPITKKFQPRAEHLRSLDRSARPPRQSTQFGRLRGQNVILVTFESLGYNHLDCVIPGGARMPLLETLRPRSVWSTRHFCISPTTNNAHRSLYTANYDDRNGSLIADLRAAGLQTFYLTTANVAYYGLKALLGEAKFEHILGAAEVGTTDPALVDRGVEELLRRRDDRPFFLHVHTAQTHVPYRVFDSHRFSRFDAHTDRGRFFNGLEESDSIISRLIEALDPNALLILSGDHGQSFGEAGYQSHGSAIVQHQINVPLVIHHADLPAKQLAYSSHFDVLPTVLDLIGIKSNRAGFGDSLFLDDRDQDLLLWAGTPSRTTTTNYGALLRDRKYMIDLVTEQIHETDWNDDGHVLQGPERDYYSSLLSLWMLRRGVK